MPASPSLRLHGITVADPSHPLASLSDAPPGATAERVAAETSVVAFRDLCAIVSEKPTFALETPTALDIERHRAIVDYAFRRTAVLPAPLGAVFRTTDVLKRWMELHYVSLTGALEFVEDRAVARVHVVRADGNAEDLEAGSDLAAAAAEAIRALRRRAVASVALRLEEITGLVLSSAFLVERESWKEFERAVVEQQDIHRVLQFGVTGPWAPYDFVRMQFAG